MIYPEIPLAQSIIQICKAKNIQNIIISPGSRNAPLTIGFASDPFFTCYSIADERCAGFFAMGMAQQTQQPTALVCTSGSAVLNYYPSVAEAFYSQIPLLVISADRPLNKIDIGDGQTIRQVDVFSNHIVYSANLQQQASENNDILINNAINACIAQKGPAHINAPFEEPLYQTTEHLSVNPTLINPQIIDPFIIDYQAYGQKWSKASKKLILVGVNNPGVLTQQVIDALTKDPSVVVLTESTSNLHNPSFIDNIDRFVNKFSLQQVLEFQPDILITFGGMVISKHIKKLLRQYQPQEHWHIDMLRHYNTYDCLTSKVLDTPDRFFSNMTCLYPTDIKSNYKDWATGIDHQKNELQNQFLDQTPWCDLKAMQIILESLPENCITQLSNSSVIRYAQLFQSKSSISVFCNRGTSGIDGCSSTAIGASVAKKDKQVVLISGDVSFLYDSNALWNNYIPTSFRAIVLNNQGGSIFRFLPGHKNTPLFNTYFETTHQLGVEHLANMYGLTYLKAANQQELKQCLEEFYSDSSKPGILEVFTPLELNDQILKQYYSSI
ncbi:2-succinyl-5-enolpyruvyl-6-hydroxy-3-cyclohexene-1-carboxylic-acid synthase [Myroides sp. LJL119]